MAGPYFKLPDAIHRDASIGNPRTQRAQSSASRRCLALDVGRAGGKGSDGRDPGFRSHNVSAGGVDARSPGVDDASPATVKKT
jgi:hypothetical protein